MTGRPGPGYWLLKAAYWYNRARFKLLSRGLQGRVEFGAGCDVWAACLWFRGPGRAVFGPGCVVERMPSPLVLDIARGGKIEFGDRTWVRGKYRANAITCFENARVSIGPDSLLNGVIISARESIAIGQKAMLSWNSVIIDSDLHAISNSKPMVNRPVTIGDYVMIGAGAMVLAGVEIGSHTVVGAGSVVTRSLPDHVVAAGVPARVIKEIDDRDRCP